MIEKLLQFLVAKIDAHLLEPVEVEDFEAGDVQHSNKANSMDKQLVKVTRNMVKVVWDYLRIEGSTRVSLHLATKYRNCLSKVALAMPATALLA